MSPQSAVAMPDNTQIFERDQQTSRNLCSMNSPDDVSGADRWVDQVTANIYMAREYLTEALQRAADWPLCSSALARALEHAVRAVFIALFGRITTWEGCHY
jgi:hypothetical protein